MKAEDYSIEYQIELNIKAAIYKDCPYFPCHDLDENNFSCMFCYCPYYDRKSKQGGCLNENGTGEYFYYKKNGKTLKIWDCSNCIYPHTIENVKKIFRAFYSDIEK